jgi:hypothetical protein
MSLRTCSIAGFSLKTQNTETRASSPSKKLRNASTSPYPLLLQPLYATVNFERIVDHCELRFAASFACFNSPGSKLSSDFCTAPPAILGTSGTNEGSLNRKQTRLTTDREDLRPTVLLKPSNLDLSEPCYPMDRLARGLAALFRCCPVWTPFSGSLIPHTLSAQFVIASQLLHASVRIERRITKPMDKHRFAATGRLPYTATRFLEHELFVVFQLSRSCITYTGDW